MTVPDLISRSTTGKRLRTQDEGETDSDASSFKRTASEEPQSSSSGWDINNDDNLQPSHLDVRFGQGRAGSGIGGDEVMAAMDEDDAPGSTPSNGVTQLTSLSLDSRSQSASNTLPSTVPPSPPPSYPAISEPTTAKPPGPEQLARIRELKGRQLIPDETWYIVDRSWYRKWEIACSGEKDEKSEEALIGMDEVGKVPSNKIADPKTGKLFRPYTEGVEVELVPEEAWNLLASWYGYSGPPLPRKVVSTTIMTGAERVEFFPPEFIFHIAYPLNTNPIPSIPIRRTTVSSGAKVKDLKSVASRLYGLSRPIRLWRLPLADDPQLNADSQASTSSSSADQPTGAGSLLVDKLREDGTQLVAGEGSGVSDDATLNDATLNDAETRIAIEEQREDGTWFVSESLPDRVHTSMAVDTEPADQPPSSSQQAPPAFSSQGGFLGQLEARNKAENVLKPRYKIGEGGGAVGEVGLKPQAPPVRSTSPLTGLMGRLTRSKANDARQKGLTGLNNLGNTCFMNSALQCLSNTKELQQYFDSGIYKKELNPDNPLGMNGRVAESFGELIERLWSGSTGSVAPREFKQVLSRFAPQFSGYMQQDSQELLAFLLDGLHEDLNRIKKKPYLETPDWNGGDDEQLVKLANLSWDQYTKRNDSVIVDLFQGQYRSTLVCPVCSKISITFDPFMYLTLTLPIKKKWKANHLYFVPLDPSKPRLKLDIELDKDASIKNAKEYVGRLLGVDPKTLLCAEEFNKKFYKWWSDSEQISDIQPADHIYVFEMPYQHHQPRSKSFTYTKKDVPVPEDEDKIIVPVYNSTISMQSRQRSGDVSAFGQPFLLAISPEHATSYEGVMEAIVTQVSRYSKKGDQMWEQEPADGSAVVGGESVIADGEAAQAQEYGGESNGPVIPPTKSRKPRSDLFGIRVGAAPQREIPISSDISLNGSLELADRIKKQESKPSSAPSPPVSQPRTIPGGFNLDEDDSEMASRYDEEPKANGIASEDSSKEMDIETDTQARPVIFKGDFIVLEWEPEVLSLFFGKEDADGPSALWEEYEIFTDPNNPVSKGAKGERELSLEQCLVEFTKEEQLGEDNMWYCPDCKKHQQASKKIDLWKVPDFLVFHFKRFSNSRYNRDKLTNYIDFPIEGLDLKEYVEGRKVLDRLKSRWPEASGDDDDEEPLIYDLYAVDNHYGGMGGGHYTAFAKNPEDDKWYNFDDSSVSPVADPEKVKTAAAYLLFYRRRTAKPIGGKSHEIVTSALQSRVASSASSSTSSLPTPGPLTSGPNSDSSSGRSPKDNLFDNNEMATSDDSPPRTGFSRVFPRMEYGIPGNASPTEAEVDPDEDLDPEDLFNSRRSFDSVNRDFDLGGGIPFGPEPLRTGLGWTSSHDDYHDLGGRPPSPEPEEELESARGKIHLD